MSYDQLLSLGSRLRTQHKMKPEFLNNKACAYEPNPSASQLSGTLLTLYWPSAGCLGIGFFPAILMSHDLGFRGFRTGIKSLPLGVDMKRLTDGFKEACGLFGIHKYQMLTKGLFHFMLAH